MLLALVLVVLVGVPSECPPLTLRHRPLLSRYLCLPDAPAALVLVPAEAPAALALPFIFGFAPPFVSAGRDCRTFGFGFVMLRLLEVLGTLGMKGGEEGAVAEIAGSSSSSSRSFAARSAIA